MSIPIYAGHSAEALADDKTDYLAIIAGLPRGDTVYAGQPEVPTTFKIFTSVADPDVRSNQAAVHADRIAAIIDLFNNNNFTSSRAALNALTAAPGFTGWEPTGEPEDTNDSNRYIASLPYIFEVFLKDSSGAVDSSIQFALENALKSFITSQNIF